MAARSGPDVEARLHQTSLYRSDLDLCVLDSRGAARIKLCFSPDNPAAKGLYLRAGFKPDKQTLVFSGRVHAPR